MRAKEKIGWIAAVFLTLLLIAVMGGYFYLRSARFQQYALGKIIQSANEATGGRAEIGRLNFNLSKRTVHLYNITFHGTESAGQPPSLHLDELTLTLGIQSLLQRKVTLHELLLVHPVAHVSVESNGKNNFPQTPPTQGGSQTSIFDLAIGHVQLSRGEIYYNDRKTPLEADVYDLDTDIRYQPLSRSYKGSLSYNSGQVRYADYSAIQHTLSLRFSASRDRFTLESVALTAGSSALSAHGELLNYANPKADVDYQARVYAQDFASLLPTDTASGDVNVTGKLHFEQKDNQPLLAALAISGDISSSALAAQESGHHIEISNLHGKYELAYGNLRVSEVQAHTFGGEVDGSFEMRNLATTPDSRLQASLHSISLRALHDAARSQQLKTVALLGTLNGSAEASWPGSINNLRARSDLTIRGGARRTSTRRTANDVGGEVPVDGAIHGNYDGLRRALTLRDTSIRIPSATLTAQGEVSGHSNLQLQLAANDFHQLVMLASSLSPTPINAPALSGSGALTASVHGSMTKPVIAAHFDAHNLEVEGSAWTSATADLQASDSQVALRNGFLVNARGGRASFGGTVGLRKWAYTSSSPIEANLDAQHLQIKSLLELAKQNYPVAGDLSAKIALHGTQLDPVGSGSAEIKNAVAYGEPLQTLALKFKAEKGAIVSTANITSPAGTIEAKIDYTPKRQAYGVQIDAPAIVLQKLQTLRSRNLEMTGTVNVSIRGNGTLDNPQLDASVRVPQLQLQQSSVAGLDAEVHVAEHRANITLDSKVSDASIHAHGHVDLVGNYDGDAAIDTSQVSLAPLMQVYLHGAPEGFQGNTELHATLKGPLRDQSKLEAHVSIPTLNASYRNLQVGIAAPIRADYVNSVVTLQPAEIRGTDTDLRVQGRFPLAGSESPTLSAQGSIDATLLQMVSPDVKSSGVVSFDVHTSGSAKNPVVQGDVLFKDVNASATGAPLGIEKLNGQIHIANDRFQIANLTGQVGGGQISMGGSVTYRPAMQFNLALQSSSVRLRYPDGLRMVLDSNLAFTGNPEKSALTGRVLIDSLSFTPDFDLAKFSDQFSSGPATSSPGFADTIALSIGVQSQDRLSATSSQVSIEGRVALRVGGTAANPVITGRTNLSSGEVFYRNVRYQLQEGVITFDDPNETRPVLNLSATTTVEQYNLTLTIRGPLDKLTTAYMSDPPLSSANVINLIARGKTTQEAAASSQTTDSMVASGAASELSGSVQKLAGLSSLEIDPVIGGGNSNPSARVAIQQRVSKNFLFTFSTDVSQPGSEIVQGEYQINKRWSVNVARDQLGGVSVDGRFHKKF